MARYKQNVTSAPQPRQTNVLSSLLNSLGPMSGNRIDGGRLFQSLGPVTWKALSPSLVWVRGTWQVMTSAERSSRRPPTVS